MITNEVVYRTVRIQHNTGAGTAFTMEKDDIQYIITAKHLFDGITNGNNVTLQVLTGNQYQPITATILFHEDKNVDCAVLKTNPYREITKKFSNENSLEGIALSQDVYFLGFPYNYDTLLKSLPDSDRPVPFVKKACLSGISEKDGLLFLDGINNPGFSGGPVCYIDSKTHKVKIAGLINSYRSNKGTVYTRDGLPTDYYVYENTGIINACSIQKVLEIIDNI